MAQYYEIVLYTPSIDGIAEPVIASLDKDGCIMHRLYRESTYYVNGIHVKDLNRLNRNVKRMVVLDDDPLEVQLNPENLIRVKPYDDPTDRTDNTLERITPFLIEIAREGYNDIPTLLQQYEGMDADEIADEQERRVQQLRMDRQRRSQQGLGGLVRGAGNLPEPELPAATTNDYYGSHSSPQQLTAKDIAGAAPPTAESQEGLMGWMHRRAKEKEEHNNRKLEKWNEVMMKKQREKREQQAAGGN
jgi:import inner membrane translocase subunit TIM50